MAPTVAPASVTPARRIPAAVSPARRTTAAVAPARRTPATAVAPARRTPSSMHQAVAQTVLDPTGVASVGVGLGEEPLPDLTDQNYNYFLNLLKKQKITVVMRRMKG